MGTSAGFGPLLALLLVMGAGPAWAAEHVVDGAKGSDSSGTGSLSKPWKTIGKAASTAKAGDRILVRQGVYREEVVPGDGQTFEAYRGELVMVTGTEPVTKWVVHEGKTLRSPAAEKVHAVFVGDAPMKVARYPDSKGDYLDYSGGLPPM